MPGGRARGQGMPAGCSAMTCGCFTPSLLPPVPAWRAARPRGGAAGPRRVGAGVRHAAGRRRLRQRVPLRRGTAASTLQGMDPEVIAYLGTASKVLTPALGVGWMVVPGTVMARLAEVWDSLGERVSEPAQHAMAALLPSGDLERHVRRMRLEYARRRAALVEGAGAWPVPPAGRHRRNARGAGVAIRDPRRMMCPARRCGAVCRSRRWTATSRGRSRCRDSSSVTARPGCPRSGARPRSSARC